MVPGLIGHWRNTECIEHCILRFAVDRIMIDLADGRGIERRL